MKQTKIHKPYGKALLSVLVVPCFVFGVFLATELPKEQKKPTEKPKQTETKTAANPLASYQFRKPTVMDAKLYRDAGEALLLQTIESEDAANGYLSLLQSDDPVTVYTSILSAYRNSKGIAEKAFDLSGFPADDSYYDNDTLALKTNLSDAITKDLSSGQYKSAYTNAGTLTASLSSYVAKKTAEEEARKEAEARAQAEAEAEAKKQAEEAAIAAEQEKLSNAKQAVEDLYHKVPDKARSIFEQAGGTVSTLASDKMPNGVVSYSDLGSRTIYMNADSYTEKDLDAELAKQLNDLEKYSVSPEWQECLGEAGKVQTVDSSMTPTSDPAGWFTQAFVCDLMHPDSFRSTCPNTAKLLDGWFR